MSWIGDYFDKLKEGGIGDFLTKGGFLSPLFAGDKPEPPDIEAERFKYDNKWIEEWVKGAETDVTQQAQEFLEKAMTGIHRGEHARGLTGTGWAGGKGTEAANISAEQLTSALANIKGTAAGMEHTGILQGMEMYGDEYQEYLKALYQDQEDWTSQMMSMIPAFV